jgi:AcrR family transcriptional regulator
MATSRREQTKAQNRETILAAAKTVFATMGFAKVTVRDIIRATPLASGTFYNYFKSKEEVYQALRDEIALQVRPRLREARASAATGEEFLAANFRTFFSFVAKRRDPERIAETSRFRMDSPEVLAGFTELREDLESAMESGLIPRTDAALLASAVSGIALELAEQVKQGAEVETVTQFATRLALGGISGLARS